MVRSIVRIAAAALIFASAPSVGRTAEPAAAAAPAQLTGSEQRFVRDISSTLAKRYPTPAAAERAGYVRYTNEDQTGAISYADNVWNVSSPDRPSQLWYDVGGRLLGADYSVLVADHPTAPALFGITPARFFEEEAHIHYVLRNADGTKTYSRAIGVKKYAAAGGDPQHPTAAGLVQAGAAPSADAVAAVFLFPHIWDVTVWVVPNPSGAFADANPNVKPSKTPSPMDMH